MDIPPIGLVAVNLYPFAETIKKEGVTVAEAIENIDIGGPTMIRATAKNSKYTTVAVDPGDYPKIIAEMKAGDKEVSRDTRQMLARKAFFHTAAYDAAISGYFDRLEASPDELPPSINMSLVRQSSLRYGENPHQRAALYRPQFHPPIGIVAAEQKHGKQLSFNNYLDLHSAWGLIREIEDTACAIIKHTNPCGAAIGESPVDAYLKALACDPVSAFGSIIAFNRTVNQAAAEQVSKLFVEAVIAPEYEADALEALTRKKNIRIMEMPGTSPTSKTHSGFDLKRIAGGVLVQDRDAYYVTEKDLKVVTKRGPTAEEMEDLLFGWIICKHVKSNAIIYVKDRATLGVGAGQMSRVDSARIAVQKAQMPLDGAVMASDAFFPFRDGLDEAAGNGIRAVIQPGGSVRDQEVIEAADEHDMAMVFTGIRHFKH
jgi:phosphoribosylaminoimidazolecarboxamide formyltransferase/IMP cyclohydrolase